MKTLNSAPLHLYSWTKYKLSTQSQKRGSENTKKEKIQFFQLPQTLMKYVYDSCCTWGERPTKRAAIAAATISSQPKALRQYKAKDPQDIIREFTLLSSKDQVSRSPGTWGERSYILFSLNTTPLFRTIVFKQHFFI